jgi:Cd2+/Zn2+-exporting ATPase
LDKQLNILIIIQLFCMEMTERDGENRRPGKPHARDKRGETEMEMRFTLEGLCCPVCAANIEQGIRKLDGVDDAAVNFSTRKLVMTVKGNANPERIRKGAVRVVRDIERNVSVVPGDKTDAAARLKRRPAPERAFFWAAMGTGAALFVLGLVFDFSPPWRFAVFAAAYLLAGGDVLLQALKNITRGRLFDENFLMAAASLGAFAIGEYPEGVAVMLFYQVGEAFQRLAVSRSRSSIAALMDIRPAFANLREGNELRKVSPETVKPGALIQVRPGERIPLDGVVTSGYSALDTSALTGESLPRDAGPGSEVLSGSINISALLEIRVTREFGESTVSKILALVENAGLRKAPVENFITTFARYYTPAVVAAAALLAFLPPLLLPGALFAGWLRRALVFLVVSCPCALVISVPLSFFGGIGGASRQGILVKGGNYLEALTRADTVVFDKTGTLTRGVFTVSAVVPQEGWKSGELLFLAAAAESNSTHPIARSIVNAYGGKLEGSLINSCEETAGKGIRAGIDGRVVFAGNTRLMEAAGIDAETLKALKGPGSGTLVHVAVDGKYAGYIAVSDEPRADAKAAVAELRAAGIKRLVMLTGDNRMEGEKTGRDLALDEVYSELLPHQKVEWLERLEAEEEHGGKLVFVGDGINDAPALARSDIGIAMGGVGSDAAIEAADIVLMTDEPSKLAAAFRVAKRTHGIVWQNIIFALGVKAVILVLGALGIATMWSAVFGDVGVALIAVFNAMRAQRLPSARGTA